MTQPIDTVRSRQHGWLIAASAAAALVLGGVTFYAVQALNRDDCTTVTTTVPDGSQVTTKTCS